MINPLEGSNPSPSANRSDPRIDGRSPRRRCHRRRRGRSPRSGSATLGESGGRPMAPRVKAGVARRARSAAPRTRSRCTRGRQPRDPRRRRARRRPVTCSSSSVGTEPERGYWGEVLTTGAEARGIVGLVIDGGVRDVERARSARLPGVLVDDRVARRDEGAARHASAARRSSATSRCDPGDWIVGDADGVIVVPARRFDDVLAAGRARAAKEAGFFDAARPGPTTMELLALDTSPVEGA